MEFFTKSIVSKQWSQKYIWVKNITVDRIGPFKEVGDQSDIK